MNVSAIGVDLCLETSSALSSTANVCVLFPWLDVRIKAAVFISKAREGIYSRGLIIELAVAGTAHISVCFFDTCHSHLSTVATKEVDKTFCVCLFETPDP